jgi:hypothetical protein
MSEVFILGAGFSKAISSEMPLVKELSAEVLNQYRFSKDIPRDVRHMIEDDFEKALTFLSQEKPWLPETENLRHKALYLDLTNVIRYIIQEISMSPLVWGTDEIDSWIEELVAYWHKNRSTVITLNYDTLIELVASSTNPNNRKNPIHTGLLYPIPLTPIGQRGAVQFGPEPMETFKLFKLHGSINWFYSGRSSFYGEELFYVPYRGGVRGTFDAALRDPQKSDWMKTTDKSALIIPPTLDKSVFFQHESLRSMWYQASEKIKDASKIICMGYSLPMSDLTMAQFLKSSAPAKLIPFEIVDINSKSEHFRALIGGEAYDFRQGNINEDCIPEFVLRHCVNDEKLKIDVARSIQMRKSVRTGAI